MGTNYYLEERPPCSECGREFEQLHIGKSSAGWCFSLHVIPEQGLNSLEDWRERWTRPGARIVNEYGDLVDAGAMLVTIAQRERWGPPWEPDALAENSAVPGPRGLARSRIEGSCIGHGDGTWDLILGDFS